MTTMTTIITLLALVITLSYSHPLFLRNNDETLSSSSTNQTEEHRGGLALHTVQGVFDTVTGLSHSLGETMWRGWPPT